MVISVKSWNAGRVLVVQLVSFTRALLPIVLQPTSASSMTGSSAMAVELPFSSRGVFVLFDIGATSV